MTPSNRAGKKARKAIDPLLDDMLFEFRTEVEENPFSLSMMKWYAFGWLLYITIKVQSFFLKIRGRFGAKNGSKKPRDSR